ncbi:MAG: hypothetical protein K8F91_07545, partial [Candidatus Obscuribacterales bacterium]|nr:hypothetical protein [Candidatus Obscuribacterales bacterium]
FISKVQTKLAEISSKIPSVDNDLSKLSAERARLNSAASTALGIYGKYMQVTTYQGIAKMGMAYWKLIQLASDPNITDEEADKLYEKASEISWKMARMGVEGKLMQTLFAQVPTLGQLHSAFMIGYGGGTFILNNTDTGQAILASSIRTTESFVDSSYEGVDFLTEQLGGQSEKMIGRQRLSAIEQKFRESVDKGEIALNQGVDIEDVVELIRQGQFTNAKKLYAKGGKAELATPPKKNQVWVLTGRPKIETPEYQVGWKRGMDFMVDFDPIVSETAMGYAETFYAVDRKTGTKKERSRAFQGQTQLGSVPQQIKAGEEYQISLDASAQQEGPGFMFIEGWLEGDGLKVTSDNPSKGYVNAKVSRPTDRRVYTITAGSSGDTKTLTYVVRRLGRVTWTYTAERQRQSQKQVFDYAPVQQPPENNEDHEPLHYPEVAQPIMFDDHHSMSTADDVLKHIRTNSHSDHENHHKQVTPEDVLSKIKIERNRTKSGMQNKDSKNKDRDKPENPMKQRKQTRHQSRLTAKEKRQLEERFRKKLQEAALKDKAAKRQRSKEQFARFMQTWANTIPDNPSNQFDPTMDPTMDPTYQNGSSSTFKTFPSTDNMINNPLFQPSFEKHNHHDH